jgi:hypothetical protein
MSPPRLDPSDDFGRRLVRFNARVLGVSLALLASAGLFVATLVLVARGGDYVGTMLGQLRYFFPGYSVTFGGAVIGALWAALVGYAVGAVFARIYGPWLLGEATRTGPGAAGRDLDQGVALLRPLPIALITGGVLAVGLFCATAWLSLVYQYPSPHLELLSNYVPGYSADFVGGIVGAPWIFLYGAAGSGLSAWLYNRIVALRSGGRSA